MKCPQVRELLVAHLDGEVTFSERILIDAHLAECATCQEELDALSLTRGHLRQYLQGEAAQAVPSPEAWSHLEARLAQKTRRPSLRLRSWLQSLLSGIGRSARPSSQGGISLAGRLAFATIVALAIVVTAILLIPALAPRVSAQEILDRAAAAQAALLQDEGILHTESECYLDFAVLLPGEETPGRWPALTIVEDHSDLATGKYRSVTSDATTDEVLAVLGYDETYVYISMPGEGGKIVIYRTPIPADVDLGPLFAGMYTLDSRLLFEQARQNPNVEYLGKETWIDGRPVYVLRFNPTISVLGGTDQAYIEIGRTTAEGSDLRVVYSSPLISTMYFDVETYALLETKETIERDGEEIVVGYNRQVAKETLGTDAAIAWDMSDLEGLTVEDASEDVLQEYPFGVISLKTIPGADFTPYVLSPIPEGYEQEISRLEIHAEGPDESGVVQTVSGPAFIITYRNQAGKYIELFQTEPALARKLSDRAEVVYRTTSGLVLYAEVAPPGLNGDLYIVETPDGLILELTTNLSLERVQDLAEKLVPMP